MMSTKRKDHYSLKVSSTKVKIHSETLQKEDLKQTNITMLNTSGYQPNVSRFYHLFKKDKMIDIVSCNQHLRYMYAHEEC